MWTEDHRETHKPRSGRYPSDVSDEEWAIVAPMIPPARTGGAASYLKRRGLPPFATLLAWLMQSSGLDIIVQRNAQRCRCFARWR